MASPPSPPLSLLPLLLLLLLLLLDEPGRGCLACFAGQRQTARVDENPMSQWSEWSQCDVTCGGGKQTRWRSGIVLPQEKDVENRACGAPCVEVREWSSWLEWSSCSLTCGTQGVRSRYRECQQRLIGSGQPASSGAAPAPGEPQQPQQPPPQQAKNADCTGDVWLQEEACNQRECPPVYLWTQWSQWSQCTATCNPGGNLVRSRQCQTERLEFTESENCDGPGNDTRQCNENVPCPYVPEWQPWSPWSSCSITCGPASSSRRRERSCVSDQSPNLCIQPDVTTETEKRDCGNPDCPPVNGAWNHWNPWSNCFVTCGWGYRTRNRLCNNPPPSNGGAECGSSSAGYERCLGGECPVDGHWGAWGACTHIQGSQCVTRPRDECREGLAMFCRQCDNPPPEFGGSPCVTGLATDRRECWNTDACNNNVVQPPMNFTVVGFLNSNDLLVKWRRAPFGVPASSFSIKWEITVTESVEEAEVKVVASDKQKLLGESYEFWIRDLTVNSELHITMATRSTAGGTLRISEPVQQNFRVSRVDGGWGQWGSYSSCSPTPDCNIPGSRSRSRKCDSPAPVNGGVTCPGSAVETSRCFHNC